MPIEWCQGREKTLLEGEKKKDFCQGVHLAQTSHGNNEKKTGLKGPNFIMAFTLHNAKIKLRHAPQSSPILIKKVK